MPLLERAFGTWKGSADAVKIASIPEAPQLTTRKIYLIDKPGAAQSQIRIGWVGVPRSTPDYATLEVLNTILGGAFTSRLNQNLREKNGYSYGARSVFETRLSNGPLLCDAPAYRQTKPPRRCASFSTSSRASSSRFHPTNSRRRKSYVAYGFPAEFETSGDLARKLEEQIVYGLPDEYFPSFVRAVMQVTNPGVQKAAARYIQPDKFAVVIVGDRKVVEPGIRALNLGPVEVLTVDHVLGPQ